VSVGCRHIQIDAPDLSFVSDPSRRRLARRGRDPGPIGSAAEGIELITTWPNVLGSSASTSAGNLPDRGWPARLREDRRAVFGRGRTSDRSCRVTPAGVGSFEPWPSCRTTSSRAGACRVQNRELEPPSCSSGGSRKRPSTSRGTASLSAAVRLCQRRITMPTSAKLGWWPAWRHRLG